jgi:penicillin-insensitive murein endopeptidase
LLIDRLPASGIVKSSAAAAIGLIITRREVPRVLVRALAAALACLSAGALAQSGGNNKELFSEWATITVPLPGHPSAIGFYSAGCLQGAEALPLDGTGYAVMRPSRRRFFGHPALISYLSAFAAARPGGAGRLLLIGDLGRPRGGPTLSGHASHQNGLDVDIWFITRAMRPTTVERERLSAPGFVIDRKQLRQTWGPAQAGLLAAAADHSDVNRIFVSPAIKRYLCRRFPQVSWLYRLRPWWGHEDHFHVRLMCPADSSLCREQDALDPADNGCGAELEWWFSAEADREWSKLRASREPRRFPELPAACQTMPEGH